MAFRWRTDSGPLLHANWELHLYLAEYREAFNLYDKDKDGIIATQKLGRVLRAMGLNPTELEIQEMLEEIDSEGNKLKKKNK